MAQEEEDEELSGSGLRLNINGRDGVEEEMGEESTFVVCCPSLRPSESGTCC